MHSLFEKQDSLNAPIESYTFDTAAEPFPVKPHWHYFAEILYILDGNAAVTCDDKTYTVSENEMILLFPSSVHAIFPAGDGLRKFWGIKFDTAKFPNTSSYAPSVNNIFRYARDKAMPVHFSAAECGQLGCREIIGECVRESEEYRYGRDVILRSQIYRLLFSIVRHWIASGLDIDRCPINSAEIYGIENIAEYIDSRLEDNIRVAEIAGICHMSYSGFAAKFREQYGMSCKDYIERMRIYKAEEYLLFTDHDLTFISQKTGFSDCSHFIRSFKRYRGMTPKQFRTQKKQLP